jgi:hypothetical protein
MKHLEKNPATTLKISHAIGRPPICPAWCQTPAEQELQIRNQMAVIIAGNGRRVQEA